MYQEVLILLPCHSLEDFPAYHEGEQAENLLACWTAMWHPALIASSKKMPQWERVEDPPSELDHKLILIPSISQEELPVGFTRRAKENNATLIQRAKSREEILDKALAPFSDLKKLNPALVADFLALGYCYLQVELLTRQMRYSSSLDELYFNDKVVEAATSLLAENEEAAREALQACFDTLAEERNQFYSVDSFFLDITLTAPSVIGAALKQELQQTTSGNLMISGGLLEQVAESQPENLTLIKNLIQDQKLGLIGGEYHEGQLTLQAPELILSNFQQGHEVYQKHLNRPPLVFGRRRFGLSSFLPQVLKSLQYQGALHMSLDEGKLPKTSQAKVRWEGVDGCSIDAIAKPPMDANQSDGFLNLFSRLSESMDSEHVATICFAHWPSMTCPWYQDLRRIEKYANCLGKFVTVEQYFAETDLPGFHDNFSSSNYQSPYLKQSVIRKHLDPLTSPKKRTKICSLTAASDSLQVMSQLLSGQTKEHPKPQYPLEFESSPILNEEDQQESRDNLDKEIASKERELDLSLNDFAAAIPRNTNLPPEKRMLIANPHLFTQVSGINISELTSLPETSLPVISTTESDSAKYASVKLPACGYASISSANSKPNKKDKNLVECQVLRNEFMEVHLSETSGGVQSIYDYKTRGNRLSQQLALRLPGPRPKPGQRYVSPDATAIYSVMAAETITPLISTPTVGEIQTAGKLLDREGTPQANFVQTYRLWRSSPILEIEIDLEPLFEPKSDPWVSYYCCRFAWGDETAYLARDVNWVKARCESNKIEASNFIEIQDGKQKTAILTGGLPFHRRINRRMIESIMIVKGETQTKFRFGVALDTPYPLKLSQSLSQTPLTHHEESHPPQAGTSTWAFHCSAKNVIATAWDIITEDNKQVGFKVRLLETEGREARGKLQCFRNLTKAIMVDFCGDRIGDCQVEQNEVQFHLNQGQWQECMFIGNSEAARLI